MTARFVRLTETNRVPAHFHVDSVLAGDAVMVARLTSGRPCANPKLVTERAQIFACGLTAAAHVTCILQA